MDNLKLWESVKKTDPQFVKKVNMRGGFSSISPQYQIQQATEAFGPYGKGWGFEAIDFDYSQMAITRLVLVKAVFFFVLDGERSTFPINNSWPVMSKKDVVDDDFAKKAETNTMSKALSKLGFSADIFMGEFDNPDYVEAVGNEFALEKAEDKIEEQAKQQEQHEEWVSASVETIGSCQTLNELQKLFTGLVRKANLTKDQSSVLAFTRAKDERKAQLESVDA